MASSLSLVRTGLVVLSVAAASALHIDLRNPSATEVGFSQASAQTTYLDDLLARARELLDGRWENPELAVGILEELIDAGSVEAGFVLADYYATVADNPANFERALSLLEGLVGADPLVEARAWSTIAALYLADGPGRDPAKAEEAYQRAANLGDTSAMISLAITLAAGDGAAEPQLEPAIELLARAAAVGDANAPRAWYELATLRRANGDEQGAVDAYRQSADRGNTSAMIHLAAMIGVGIGVEAPDFESATALLARAAEDQLNAGWAWVVLAELYLADSENRDAAKAINAYQEAAERGDTSAMISLGLMLANGEGVASPEIGTAIVFLSRAAEAGDRNAARAWSSLAALYRGVGDDGNAVAAYRNAAGLGDTNAMIQLATMLGGGAGVETPDVEGARALLEQAIAAGDGNAAGVLAEMYLQGEARDAEKAVEAFRHAADLGETGAMISLAGLLAAGDGVAAPDVETARTLLSNAAAIDDANAARAWVNLAILHRGSGDLEEAVAAFAKAAERGNTIAMIELATMLRDGVGVDAPDYRWAVALLEQAIAADEGNAAWAWGVLGELYLAESEFRNPVTAFAAFEQAANLGDTSAMISVAGMLASGEGVDTPNVAAALDILIRVAEINDAGAPRAWSMLAGLYRDNGDPQSALTYLELLSETGDGYAHLAAAEIISASPNTPAAREAMVMHFRAAAELLGTREMARAMLNINTVALYASVQALLVEAGYSPGSVDGRFGPRTEEALADFCADRQLTICLPSIVTVGLLTALLEPADQREAISQN